MHLISTDNSSVGGNTAGRDNGCGTKKVDEKDHEKQADDSALAS